jgi:DNA polymerase-1
MPSIAPSQQHDASPPPGEAPELARGESPVLTLIDASGFIFRAYHAITALSTSKGVPTNAVYGFTRMLLKTLREFSPTHVALAFDKQSRLGRQAIDPTYKANRQEPPVDLVPQFELIRRVVNALNVPVLEVEGWEADDVIGTLAARAKQQGFKVLVVTADKDFVQIVDDDIRLYDPMLDKHTGPGEVRERFGIRPDQMRDYLALVGDSIDNIPKVPGIGPKTASELLQEFGSVETLLAQVTQLKKPKIREALQTNAEQLLRAKTLVSFRVDLPIDVDIANLVRRPIHDAQTRTLFSELEFFKLLQEMPPAAVTALEVPTQIVNTVAQLEEIAKCARAAKSLTLIPAFEGLPYASELVGLGIALPDGKNYYAPLQHQYIGVPEQLPISAFTQATRPVLEDAAIKKSGHDLKSLILVLASLGLKLEGVEGDVQLLSYLLNPSRRQHALTDLSRERLHAELPPDPVASLARKRGPLLSEVPVEQCAASFGARADAARRLADALWPEIEAAGMSKLAREMEVPLIPVLARMERKGVRMDRAVLSGIQQKVDAECEAQLAEIYRHAGHEFNVNSNSQLAEVLYAQLKLPILKRGKTGPSTDQEVLDKLAEMHPLAKAITDYRVLAKLKSTYLETLPELLAADGRLHTSFHQASTATGRLSSSDPNLQNIPIRSELGREIRMAFVADEGHQLISADYSQIELRLLAHIADDPALIEAFRQDEDIHTRTAAEVFRIEPSQLTPNHRRAAKAVNFGIAYGLSPHGLSIRLDISNEEARLIIDRYFERYGGIRRYLEETIEKARRVGYVETLFGRRRFMPELHSRNRAAAQAAERAAINMPIQGTAADLIKMAMVAFDREATGRGLKAQMLLQVHDELLLEAPDAEVEEAKELVCQVMCSVTELKVPLKVEVGVGRSWADAH